MRFLKYVWFLAIHSAGQSVHGQWMSVDGGVSNEVRCFFKDSLNDRLLIGGKFPFAGSESIRVNNLAWWDGANWSSEELGNGNGDTSMYGSLDPVLSVVMRHDTLFASFLTEFWQSESGFRYAGMLINDDWQHCGDPNSTFLFLEANGRMFSGGVSDSLYGMYAPGLYEWHEGAFEPIPNMPFNQAVGIYDVEYWQGRYYFGGNFDVLGSPRVVSFDGIDQWEGLGGGVGGYFIETVCGYGDSLFVGGWLTGANVQSRHAQIWDGTSWQPFFPQIMFEGVVRSMEVNDGILYIAGTHSWAGDETMYGLLRFDGHELCSIGGPMPSGDNGQITFLDDDLYLAVSPLFPALPGEYIARLPLDSVIPDRCADVATAVQEVDQQEVLRLYPNPVHKRLMFTTNMNVDLIEAMILDMSGRCVGRLIEQRADASGIDVGHLAPGHYVLAAVMNGGLYRASFVKQ